MRTSREQRRTSDAFKPTDSASSRSVQADFPPPHGAAGGRFGFPFRRGALRVSELASLTWGQVLPRETGEAQLAIIGKGAKPRNVSRPLMYRQTRLAAHDHQPQLDRWLDLGERTFTARPHPGGASRVLAPRR